MSNKRKETVAPLPVTAVDDGDEIVDIGDDESTVGDADSTGETSLAKDETKVVRLFRTILMVLLVFTAVAVCLTAFFMTREGEIGDFEGTFEDHATKIIETFESEAEQKRTAIIHLSRELTSQAKFANSTWPFVSLPDFEMRARLTLELADVIALFVLPLVTRENLQKWAEYSVANQAWYWEGMAIQSMFTGLNATTSGVEHFDDPDGLHVHGEIYKFTDSGPEENLVYLEDSDEGPFFPVWQFSPQIPVPVVNADFGTLPFAEDEIKAYVEDETRRNMVGPALGFENESGGAAFTELLLQRYQGGGSHYTGGPLSYYYIPIYEDFEPDTPLVGLVMAFIYWQTYFENLLPDTARGIHVVLESTCDQVFTFEVSGSNATFLGYEDYHDAKYDYLEAYTDYGAFLQRAPENNGGCYYRLRIYPTQRFEDDYVTFTPWLISLSLLAVFVFTTVVFFLYDTFVERRQQLVLKTAKQSGDVVSNLFPETVRERLYEKDKKPETTTKGQFLRRNNRAGTASGSDHSRSTDPLKGASPIADEYMNCTVFFADLAGFTKWSSTRTPSEVFQLLETLYGAFDKIAKKLGVFKIETIGDCYVAVTGLPFPQEDHALIMCRFAASSMFKMNQIINGENLLLSLGDDTCNLAMRVGMHSGPVTAGVLRGEKARFQLFGDTVNTASRMESNGQKGRIQVSQPTADLLVAAGKESWLTAREDLVEAKGKGKMQTYWVEVTSTGTMTNSFSEDTNPIVVDVEPPLLGIDPTMMDEELHESFFDEVASV